MPWRNAFAVAFGSFIAIASSAVADNVIQRENARPGTAEWQLYSQAADREIEGYASATSVNRGEQIRFFVSTTSPTYTIAIYRLGWYGGTGGRLVYGPVQRTGSQQPVPQPDPVTGLVECNWSDPFVLSIPGGSDPDVWPSGVYVAKLVRPDREGRYIVFVVRDDARASNHLMVTSVNTAQAYNSWGGKSLYGQFTSDGKAATKVSFNRPYADGAGTGQFLWRWEFNMVRFLEREGYDVSYATDVDLHRRGTILRQHRDLVIAGHPEYWSWEMRASVEAARDDAATRLNVAWFSGNSCYWQVRYEPSPATGEADRTIVGYKETALQQDPFALDTDTSNDHLITTNWRSAPVNRPEAAFVGVQYIYDEKEMTRDVVIDDVASAPWVFERTGLHFGDHIPYLLGYEVDAMSPDSPPGTIRLGHSPFTNIKVKPNQTQYSDMTLYTAPSGAQVFSTGTIQWSWGLDDWVNGAGKVSAAAQQLTRNVLARFAGDGASGDCQFVVTPGSISMTAAGGNGSVTLQAHADCSWTASSDASWLTVTSSASGSGDATITYNWQQNAGPARTATLTVGDKAIAVTQSACSITLSPSTLAATSSGLSTTVNVTADAGCQWSTNSGASWVTLDGQRSGSGNGTFGVSIASTSGPSRSAVVTVGNQTLSITQASGCTWSLSPTKASIGAGSGGGSFSVTTSDATCTWTATSDAAWTRVTSAASGTGNATIRYAVDANDGPDRDATLTVGSAAFQLHQASGCSYTLDAAGATFASAGGSASVQVSASSACSWSSESHDDWLSITSGSRGRGNGNVTYTVAPNGGNSTRVGSLTIAGTAFTVTQAAAGAPTGLAAHATAANAVHVTWNPASGASTYSIARSANNGFFMIVTTVAGTSFDDTGLTPDTTYLYEVRANDAQGTPSPFSNIDAATTTAFTPIVPRVTPARASDLLELRTAANAFRRSAGLPSAQFSAPSLAGAVIRADDLDEVRRAIAEARTRLGLPAVIYSNAQLRGTAIRKADIDETRASVD